MTFDSKNQNRGNTAMQEAMERAEQGKTEKGAKTMAKGKGDASSGALKVNFPLATKKVSSGGEVTSTEDIKAIMERASELDNVFADIPGQVVAFCEQQEPTRQGIRDSWDGASENQREALRSKEKTLDLELDVIINATFGNFDEVERPNVQRVVRVTYIGWLVRNCQPSMGAVEWVVKRSTFLGVLVTTTNKDEKQFVWVGKEKYVLPPEIRKAEEVVAEFTNAEDPYNGIIRPLIKLVKDAKTSRDHHVAGLNEKLYEGLTPGATIEDLLAGKGEVMLLLIDPGEGNHQGGRVRVFLKDGLVSPRACMGGNHRKVGELIGDGTAIPVEALSDDDWKGDGAEEWILHKILRRAVVNEQDRLARKREGEAKLTETIADAEAEAKVISTAENVPIISVEEFHAGKVGLAIVLYGGAWKTKSSDRKSPKFWHPVMLVQRKGKAKATRKIVVRWASETAQALLKTVDFPMNAEFAEVSTEERWEKDLYGGVNAPVRQFLQTSSRFVKSQIDADVKTTTKPKAKMEAEAG